MNRTRSLLIVGVLSSVLAAGAGAFAQDGGRDGGGRRGGPRGEFAGRDAGLPLRGIDLTDAQKQQIQTLTTQMREQNRAAFERMRSADEAFQNAVDATPVNEQAIRAAAQSRAIAQADVAIVQAKLRTQVLALLTPEQQAQVAKRRSERESRGPENRGQRPPRS